MGKKRRKEAHSNSQSGTSSSDLSPSSTADLTPKTKDKSDHKRQRTTEREEAVKNNLKRFEYDRSSPNKMASTTTETTSQQDDEVFSEKADHSSLSITNADLMRKLCDNGKELSRLSLIVEELRGTIFTLQTENDRLSKEVKEAKEREEDLRSKLTEVKHTAELADKRSEDLSSYVRRNNMRIFGIDEATGNGRQETTQQCEDKVLSLFREKLKLKIERNDIEAVHRIGSVKPGNNPSSSGSKKTPRTIIVRFVNRKTRDEVLYSRKNLRGSGVVMVEDLTPRAYTLLRTARSDGTVCRQAWSKNGKIVVKTLTDRIVTIEAVSDLAEHRRACEGVWKRELASQNARASTASQPPRTSPHRASTAHM